MLTKFLTVMGTTVAPAPVVALVMIPAVVVGANCDFKLELHIKKNMININTTLLADGNLNKFMVYL